MKCKVLIVLIILICIIAFSFSFYIIFNDFQEKEQSNKDTENLIKETIIVNEKTEEKNIDWDKLKEINKDIIAWIEIPDTIINYPILKDNNLYYLKHSYNKKYNSNGSIFTTNKNPFEEFETLLYGHNMKNGSMFSTLDKYMDENFLYTHQKFKIYTPNENYEATIFSVYSIGVNTESNNIKELNFEERIDYYKKASKITIKADEKITQILCNDIMGKIKTKDYENIKSIFSNDMIKNVTNLDEGINKLIDISNENILDFKVQENGTETHWNSGKHRKTYRFSIDINTDNKVYSISFEYDYENPFNTKTLGVNRMVILDEERNILVLVDNENINKGY